eukprot:CAMPEP_0197670910 /NCGR_PEP_ID=MMETSP1338-20131121/75588_1 /TAXON_ID=43686 ORGANISM="Pelagodinium beii, Strain RCC1491" /NCGR_SAMPLE_ID=MMETSP1338 /ASSEMBLY_ACC=CAM_ASM_000754 /LENGTH=46 /DNA_ID= /DNA_START= /DNA_END= /DNA_ORIENTATION=
MAELTLIAGSTILISSCTNPVTGKPAPSMRATEFCGMSQVLTGGLE